MSRGNVLTNAGRHGDGDPKVIKTVADPQLRSPAFVTLTHLRGCLMANIRLPTTKRPANDSGQGMPCSIAHR